MFTQGSIIALGTSKEKLLLKRRLSALEQSFVSILTLLEGEDSRIQTDYWRYTIFRFIHDRYLTLHCNTLQLFYNRTFAHGKFFLINNELLHDYFHYLRQNYHGCVFSKVKGLIFSYFLRLLCVTFYFVFQISITQISKFGLSHTLSKNFGLFMPQNIF